MPIGLLLLAAGARLLPADRPDATTGLDLPGLLTLSPAVLLLVTPLVLGHELGWPVWGWGWGWGWGNARRQRRLRRDQRRAARPLVPPRCCALPVWPSPWPLSSRTCDPPGVLFQAATIVSGVGLGLAFSPGLHAALAHVSAADAANANGVMSTVTQLGHVAGLGAVFLALGRPSGSAATAAAVTTIGVAALVFLAAVLAVFLPPAPTRGTAAGTSA